MLIQGRRTSVVWSFKSSRLDSSLLPVIHSQNVDAIRIAAEPGKMGQSLEFLASLKSKKEQFPILVDLYSQPRGVINCSEDGIELSFGDEVSLFKDEGKGDISLTTSVWDSLFLKDSLVYCGVGCVLKVKSINASSCKLEVVQGGHLFDKTKIYVPNTNVAPTIKDIPDEAWLACENENVDYIILPSFECEKELEKVITRIKGGAHQPWILLKLGSEGSYNNLEKLLPLVHGVLLSRVELSTEMDPAVIPMITKEVIQTCKDNTKISLVASHMLASMKYNATPTRAEVSDIGNAVLDGADAVVLSEELAEGKYAARGLDLAQKTIVDVEKSSEELSLNWQKEQPAVKDEIHAVTYAAYRAAFRNNAKAIVCITKMGNTAIHLASFDNDTPIIAISLDKDVVRRLKLVRGVDGVSIDELPQIDQVLPLINNLLSQRSWLSSGDKYVFVSVSHSSIGVQDSNLFTIQSLD